MGHYLEKKVSLVFFKSPDVLDEVQRGQDLLTGFHHDRVETRRPEFVGCRHGFDDGHVDADTRVEGDRSRGPEDQNNVDGCRMFKTTRLFRDSLECCSFNLATARNKRLAAAAARPVCCRANMGLTVQKAKE